MDINISKYYPTETFKRNGVDCIICMLRNRLIKKNPEELVRQAFVKYLIIEKKIPLERIEIEFPLTRINKGDKKRADILVYGDERNEKIVLVVECKKENWDLTDKDVEQAKYYNSVLKANFIILTNGIHHLTYRIFENAYKSINLIPTYNNLLKNHTLKKYIIEEYPYERNTLEELYSSELHESFIEWGHIGVDTNKDLFPFISNLVDLLFDKNSKFESIHFKGHYIVKDLGTANDSFGNAAGGAWPGEYKKLLVKNKNGDHQTIGIGIFGSAKLENDPRFGNTRGYTYLVVSIDDFDKSHNSLQLNIDKNVKIKDNNYLINHDGKMTNGHRGSIKFEMVKGYLKIHAPHLLTEDNIIQLGRFPDRQLYLASEKNSINFITNLIEYAILRDEIRRLM